MDSGLGKAGFMLWIKNTNAEEVFPDLELDKETKIIDILEDDFYKSEDIYNLMEQAFKAGIFFKS